MQNELVESSEVVNVSCRTCVFCQVVTEAKGLKPGQAFCRYNPPVGNIVPMQGPGGQVAMNMVKVLPPIVPDDDYCSRHPAFTVEADDDWPQE